MVLGREAAGVQAERGLRADGEGSLGLSRLGVVGLVCVLVTVFYML